MPHISENLREAIRTYCHEMDGVDDLRKSIEWGGERFFVDEFAEAIRSRAFTPTSWGRLTMTDLDPDDDEQLDRDLRYVWSKVAADRPFPGDEEPTRPA